MILVDTSAWVEYLRGTGSPAHRRLRTLLARGAALATTEVVLMELLAGARDETHAHTLRRMLLALEPRPLQGGDFEEAATLYRRCRQEGDTVRSLMDCLVAALAMREGLAILAQDRDFQVIARHAPLQLVEA